MTYDGYGMPDMAGTFARLGDLGNVYDKARKEGLKEQTLANLGQAMSAPGGLDYNRVAGAVAQTGDLTSAMAMIKLGEDKKALQDFLNSPLFGGGQPTQPPQGALAPHPSGPVTSGPRPDTLPPLTRGPANVAMPPPVGTANDMYEAYPQTDGPRPQAQPAPQAPQPAAAVGQRFPQVPMQSANPAAGNIPMLISAVARLPAGGMRTAAEKMLEHALKSSDLPEIQKNYALYRSQGGTASFNDYEVNLKRAGAPPEGEKEYDKITGKHFAEYNVEIAKGAVSARGKIATLTRLDQLLSNPAVYTGTGGNTVASIKRLGASLGIDVKGIPDGAAASDAIRSISNQFALELRNPAGGAGMPGAMSDKDREFLQAMVPGLGQTPEGNKLLVDYMKRVSQRAVDVEQQRQAYVRRVGRMDEGFFRHLADWSDKNPLFPEADTVKPQQNAPRAGQARNGINWSIVD